MPRRLPAALLLALPLVLPFLLPAPASQSQSITLDGQLDPAAYTLLAADPTGDLATPFSSDSSTAWMDLTSLHVATDTTNLYVFVALPNYSHASSTGEIGLAIDTTGDTPSSGGASDPWNNAVTYAYTATQNNISSTVHTSNNTILPDFVIRGRIRGTPPTGGDVNNGWTELRAWTGSEWSGAAQNWGGITEEVPGAHIAYSTGHGVEFAIPFADLAIAPTATVNLEFYVTRHTVVEGPYGAIDTIPSDSQSAIEHNATTERDLATWPPSAPPPPPPPPPPTAPPPSGACDGALLADGAVITTSLTHLDADSAYRSPTGTLASGQAVTLTLKSCAHDLASVALLVWNPSDPLASPTKTYTLTAIPAAPDYTLWRVLVPPPAAATNRYYAFRLTDNTHTSFVHPTQPNTGPAQWSPSLQPNRWLLAMAGPPPPPPPPPPNTWRLFLPNLLR